MKENYLNFLKQLFYYCRKVWRLCRAVKKLIHFCRADFIGIVFLADFDQEWWDSDNDMSRAALISVITLIKALKEQFPNINALDGHNEWKNNVGERSCPSEY